MSKQNERQSSAGDADAAEYEKRIREKVWASECLTAGEWVYLVGLFHAAREYEELQRSSAESEPVAWRWKVSPMQLNWQYSDAPPAKHPVHNLELLYRALPQIPQRLEIIKLVLKEHGFSPEKLEDLIWLRDTHAMALAERIADALLSASAPSRPHR